MALPAVLVVAALAGAATSVLQTVLPDVVAPLANSAGSWCLVAWLLARPAATPARGAVRAVVALVALVAGYYLVSGLRGFGVDPATVGAWVVVAVVVGPWLGLGAVGARRSHGSARVLGALVLPVLLVVEAAYGLTVVGDTTSTAYWVGEAVVAVLLAAAALRRRPHRAGPGPGPDLESVSVR